MLNYISKPLSKIEFQGEAINSFIDSNDQNIDWTTVNSFGDEWAKFDDFSKEEIEQIGNDYFDLVDKRKLIDSVVLDVGCGSGRWSNYLCSRVKFIEAIDPSGAVITATKMLKSKPNVRVTQASVENIPFERESFDLVISLGVLHHIPDTHKALEKCVEMVKKGGECLIYLYYNLDNRGFFYKSVFNLSHIFRLMICRLPSKLKKLVCDGIAFTIYWPLSRLSRLFYFLGLSKAADYLPLSYYRDKSIQILRNDALDRFGTPLEQRFSRKEIKEMMMSCGLKNIKFSENPPFWHAIGVKS